MTTPLCPLWMKERGIEPPAPVARTVSPQPLGEGPGTVLLEMNRADYGVPPCKDCSETARRMNEGGPQWCLENIEQLTDEIKPRVDRWLELGELPDGTKITEPTWAMKLKAQAPDAGKRHVIRTRIRKAVKRYRQQQEQRLNEQLAELPADVRPLWDRAQTGDLDVLNAWQQAWSWS